MSSDEVVPRLDLLLVEDNPGDVHLVQHALKRAGAEHRMASVPDGTAALAYLRRQGQYLDSPRPDVILLDLNLPKRSGLEVLRELKSDPELQDIPVVVLTSSDTPRDVRQSYALNANCFITKPAELHDFLSVVRVIETFWCRTVRLPRRSSGSP